MCVCVCVWLRIGDMSSGSNNLQDGENKRVILTNDQKRQEIISLKMAEEDPGKEEIKPKGGNKSCGYKDVTRLVL